MRRHKSDKPMRRCIGCYSSFPQDGLIRFTIQNDRIVADGAENEGRGFYLCKRRECFDMAIKKKAFNRVLKRYVDPDELEDMIEIINQ